MRSWKDGALTSVELRNNLFNTRNEPALDLIAAVKGLHELTPHQLSKLIRDSGSNVVRHIAEDGSVLQIDVEKFARFLPLHFIAVVMAWERDKSTFKYLLCGVLLLHAMCDLATRVPKIGKILLHDVKVSEQLIDLVFYLLLVLGAYRKENQTPPNDKVLLHSALVACSLKLLTVIVSPQYQDVAQVLTAYYKVDIFMDATFAAVCVDVKILQAKVSAEHTESSANTLPTNEKTLIHLCQQCDGSLNFLLSACQQQSFRERLVKNKGLCGKGGVLSLVQAVMSLKLSPLYSASSSYISSVSRLKSKALSILLILCEAESVSYLDEVASTPGSQNLAKSIALQVLELLKRMFGIDSRQLTASYEGIHLKGQLELNAMRLADVFSDDSNFRSFIMIHFTEALTALFLVPHGEFLSDWCSSQLPINEDNASLDVPSESYAHHITSLLIKVIANLHCFVPEVCQDEKDIFLNKFVRSLQKEPLTLADGVSSTFDTEMTMTVIKNLCSLLSHAESLVPRFLNEDDVQLLRLFKSQFESLIVTDASEDHTVQDAQNLGLDSSPVRKDEAAANQENGDVNMEDGTLENQEVDQSDVGRSTNNESIVGENTRGLMEHGKPSGSTMNSREIERDARTVEVSGSDSSPTQGRTDQMDIDRIRGSDFKENMEDEKTDAMHSDEKQQRKRKRALMNDKQIALVEAALVDEPYMHRHANLLKLWADKLSLHGSEVTTSRLKNWLNNRKARLARVNKDVCVPREGDNPDRREGPGPHSPIDDARVLHPASKGNIKDVVTDTNSKERASVDQQLGSSLSTTPRDDIKPVLFEPGQYVKLVGENAEEIGNGKLFQVHGKWCERSLEESGVFVVDIVDLLVDRSAKFLHPMEVTGDSFDEAEKRLGLMRVLWDSSKIFQLPPR